METSEAVQMCEMCGRYMTSDREMTPMPASALAPNEGTATDPLPAVSFGNGEMCQLCAYAEKSAHLMASGFIVAQGECVTCDNYFWSKPTLDPGGPVAHHDQGSVHGATHCTCGRRELGCGTTD